LRDAERSGWLLGKALGGGEKQRCAWLKDKDKYGVSWQIVSSVLGEMLQDKDPKKAKRVMETMLQMDKIASMA
jgi:predicted 3-demethylubiquinone-9 3-methyltransferase (glyoxalase superfamily)